MLALVMDDVDATLLAPDRKARPVYDQFADLGEMTDSELEAAIERATLRYTDPARFRRMQQQDRTRQMTDLREKTRPLLAELRRAQRRQDPVAVERIKGELKKLGIDPDRRRRPGRNRGAAGRVPLLRASDLPQPAPDGHFLREFGQSDREQIEASHEDPTVPQVLNLMNGFVEDYVLAPASVVMKEVHQAAGVTAKIKAAYLAVLSRPPTGQEVAMWRDDVTRDVAQGIEDLVWALVNTHEFRFVK
jgi:hypothetical protein